MIQKKKTRTIPKARPKKKTKKEKSPEASVEEAPEEEEEIAKDEETDDNGEEDDDDDADIFDVCKQGFILMQYSIILLGLFIIFLMQLIGMIIPQDFAESNTAAQLRAGAFQFYSTFFKGQKFCPCGNETGGGESAVGEEPLLQPPSTQPFSSENVLD